MSNAVELLEIYLNYNGVAWRKDQLLKEFEEEAEKATPEENEEIMRLIGMYGAND